MRTPGTGTAIVGWAIGPAFLVLAGWFLFFSPQADIPRTEIREVDLEQIKPGALRTPLLDASKAMVGGLNHSCSECHKVFTSREGKHELLQHKEIVLKHGMNARCLNCHHGESRDNLVLHDGTLVAFDQSPRLCSQCHGTVYRDWQRGMHGKTMGSWDAASGKQYRLSCSECHDPHSPAFPAYVPLPGPSTLRMGDQSHKAEPKQKHSPLRRWSEPATENGPENGHEHKDEKSKESGS
jgi:hypothetical protein